MLQLQQLQLTHFRNYQQHNFQFDRNIVGICGANGVGKTNLIDAIYYLSFSKSYFSRTDASNVQHNLQGFRISGDYLLNQKNLNTTCIVRENNKKEFSFNKEEYTKFSEHIGKLPCVMIAPDDVELISGAAELRRKFIDVIISQINKDYLNAIIKYNQLLLQRNSILKKYPHQYDDALFSIITDQFIKSGDYIFKIRQQFLTSFLPKVIANYLLIAESEESIQAQYSSQLQQQPFKDLLKANQSNDFQLQRTTVGTHKDDIEFLLNNVKFKTIASQGQRKSLLFALKLSEWQTIQEHKGFYPILLLDDVFEKLDEHRMQNLLHMVTQNKASQIFITDTHLERLEHHLKNIEQPYQIVQLSSN
ncbi:MAG: DNA replication and repair protein RecF [Chitinophagaceae bacterium]|nr:DNA replication and repair protein RecF [Chitinophagaceae bacterium]